MSLYDVNGNIIVDTSQSEGHGFLSTAYLKLLKTIATGTIQGCCTDGTYLYYITNNTYKIFKYNILTGEETSITYSSGLYGHANDMTYNPVTGKIYVATMDASGALRQVNPSTLADEGAIVLKNGSNTAISVSGIAYNRDDDSYIASSNTTYYFFDNEFNFVSQKTYNHGSEWTYQGLECDADYIYRPLWQTGINDVDVLTHNLNFVKRIYLPNDTEVETLANNWDGTWYIDFNTPGAGGGLYYLGMFEDFNYNAVDSLAHAYVS